MTPTTALVHERIGRYNSSAKPIKEVTAPWTVVKLTATRVKLRAPDDYPNGKPREVTFNLKRGDEWGDTTWADNYRYIVKESLNELQAAAKAKFPDNWCARQVCSQPAERGKSLCWSHESEARLAYRQKKTNDYDAQIEMVLAELKDLNPEAVALAEKLHELRSRTLYV